MPGPAKRARFEEDAHPVLATLSRALHALVRAIPGGVDGPRGLERALDIDYVLAWRVFRVATAADPGAVGADIPRAAPMRRLLAAAEAKGVKQPIIQRVRTAYAKFEDLVRRHAGEDPKRGPGKGSRVGGRAVFNTLIGGVNDDSSATLDLANRRAAFKANACTWGIQTHTTLMLNILNQGAGPDSIDSVLTVGYLDLHAVRKNINFRLLSRSGTYDASNPESAFNPRPSEEEVAIFREFSTDPLPRLHTNPGPLGAIETSMAFDEIGKTSAIDIFTIGVNRNAWTTPQPWYGATKGISVPTEVAIIDMLIPRGRSRPDTVRFSTHGHVSMYESVGPRLPEFQMPVKEHPEHLGTDLNSVETPEVPRYRELVQSMLHKLGWIQTEFDLYRCRIRYPIMHTVVQMRVDSD